MQIQAPDPTKQATLRVHAASGKPTPFTEQLLSLDGKITTTLHFSDTPSASVYEWIATYASLKAKSLKDVPVASVTGSPSQ